MTATDVSLDHLQQPTYADRPDYARLRGRHLNPVDRCAQQRPQDTGPMHGRGGDRQARQTESRRHQSFEAQPANPDEHATPGPYR